MYILRFLSALLLFHASSVAAFHLFPRQQQPNTVSGSTSTSTSTSSNSSSADCLPYAIAANLSTINSNSTYRAAFIQSSPFGYDQASHILNTATKQQVALVNNQSLNTACGNLTVIAETAAPLNFTAGLVGEYRIASGARVVGRPDALVGSGVVLAMLLACL